MSAQASFLEDHVGLSGRVAMVTGAASGIGEGIARTLAAAGAAVIVADRNEDGARSVAESWLHRATKQRTLPWT